MKKCLLVISIVSVSLSSIAQTPIPKGAVLLGGNVSAGINTRKSSDTVTNKDNGFTLSFAYGKAIKENLILGWGVSGGYQKYETIQSYNFQRAYTIGANVFLRKYKQLGSSGFAVFAQSTLGVFYSNSKTDSDPTSFYSRTKGWGVNVTAYPGLSYAVSKKLQLETGFNNFLTLGYTSSTETRHSMPSSQKYTTNQFTFSSSLNNLSSLYLGFRILLM